mmetsp:Transcript_20305/g.49792  ORF Transcript_20305/g.49792 Transcript_20305/m.49792 type:complete len:465 (-) Transcript_20305:357-1751(-)
MVQNQEGSALSASAPNDASCFCNIPNVWNTSSSSSRQLAGRKRPRSANDGGRSENEMASLIAVELNRLTFQERETVYEELHAIAVTQYQNQPSDEEMLKLINQTREHIATLRRNNKKAYNRAVFLNPEYVDSDEFLSLFVIGEKLQPLNAAKKVVDHFAIKAQLFAPHLLAKKITYQDLDQEDQKTLGTGSFQSLGTDNAGRTVVLGTPCHEYKHVDNQVRAMWYIFMRMAEEPSSKKYGMVLVYYLSSTLSNDNRHIEFYYRSNLIVKGVPFVVKGNHFCFDNEIFRPIMSAMQLAIGKEMRLRFRSHFGSTIEIQYSLQTFGISGALLHLGKNGNLIAEKFREYFATIIKKEREEEMQNGNRILCPTSVDVLLGRGRHPQEHVGNLNLANLVDAHIGTYASIQRQDKKGLHASVVQSVKSQGGRFLKRGLRGEGWEVVGDETAIDKVRNRFREAISHEAKKL